MPTAPWPRLSPVLSACLLGLLGACAPAEEHGRQVRSERDAYGLLTCSEATDATTCIANRAILGVSMGASGAGQLALQRPELFDSVGMLGIPFVDWTYMLRNIERGYLGGFCDEATILEHLGEVADPTGAAFCGPVRGEVKLEPSGRLMESDQDFNHWFRGADGGRGGRFGRNTLRDSFKDLALAYGNPLVYNPESPYLPPGVPRSFLEAPEAERCASPLVLHGKRNKEFNPTGEHDVIAFCDSSTEGGDFIPARPSERAAEIMLAVDYNRNGVRDFAEPVLVEMHERYEDVGVGSTAPYDWDTNPTGTAKNWRYDEGEPFADDGLDGVPGTGDFGEGNGSFDWNPNVLNYLAQDPRTLIERVVPDGHLRRLNLYADAGLRDFLQSAAGTNWFWAALEDRVGPELVRDYTSIAALRGDAPDLLGVRYAPDSLGRHVYLRYGDPDASAAEIERGDGNHVGPADQALDRFFVALSFIESRFLDPDRRASGVLDNFGDLVHPMTFHSQALGEERRYGLVLPPGYDRPENADERYPIVYMMHGQGMSSQDLLVSAILFFGYMGDSDVADRVRRRESDWAKFILVFPDSTCDPGRCTTGNFNTNHRGIDGEGPRYMDSLLELMALVESTYRVAPPVELPWSEVVSGGR